MWGSDDDDGDLRGDDDIDDIRPRPPLTTINLSDKEKGGLSDEEKGGLSDKEKGGGVATVDAWDGDTTNKEKIRMTTKDKEK